MADEILTPEQVKWAQRRASLKDDLRFEVIDWKRILDSHEALRAERDRLAAENERLKGLLRAHVEEPTDGR